MPIPCPRCERTYDEPLFEYGRTIDCTCGARVAPEVRDREVAYDRSARFVVDAMLGKLARWLRTLGYDTRFEPDWTDEALVRLAFDEERILLTRDRGLCEEWRFEGCVVLEGGGPTAQLRALDDRFGIGGNWKEGVFTRCLTCNGPLREAGASDREEARNDVPEDVAETPVQVVYCEACRQLFWEGSHTRRMRTFLLRVLGPGDEGE